ncbi:glutaredoxin family protein [Synechococcus sp. HK05]|uniref:glutaredoxin family protein n=1 Tax=Synechococcus sp. HK05 TaxID=2725975 RepID=UPI001C38184B|nr:glutaredoxin family protein [Synechococcus sp. HK05]MBV2351560.1 glutaredoxin family protein [Synechococcus sp. HK05]
MAELVLITREGCCLCEGLEEKLLALALPFSRLDVDADPQLLARFDLEVPVLLVREAGEERQLPRVSPRLPATQLHAWLKGHGVA